VSNTKRKFTEENSKKITFYLANETEDLLNMVLFLTKIKKVHLLNLAIEEVLKKTIEENELEEKIEMLKKIGYK
jgi:hypothetical protein